MAPPVSTVMTLYCQVFGDKTSFSAEILRENSVDKLRGAIITKNPNRFRGIDAFQLVVWKWNKSNKVEDSDLDDQNLLNT